MWQSSPVTSVSTDNQVSTSKGFFLHHSIKSNELNHFRQTVTQQQNHSASSGNTWRLLLFVPFVIAGGDVAIVWETFYIWVHPISENKINKTILREFQNVFIKDHREILSIWIQLHHPLGNSSHFRNLDIVQTMRSSSRRSWVLMNLP